MGLRISAIAVMASWFVATSIFASVSPVASSETASLARSEKAFTGIMLAKKGKKSPAKKATKSRELNVERQANYKKDQKKIDFESAALYGQRKAPLGSMIGQGKSDKNFDLIRMRERWHPEMYRSTSTLELGR